MEPHDAAARIFWGHREHISVKSLICLCEEMVRMTGIEPGTPTMST
ncbi:MAG: hypothetical protein VXY05_04180 [Pseudomonadota bacterium]|nr:hypothetical protein [Pseudomonadota bacterium]